MLQLEPCGLSDNLRETLYVFVAVYLTLATVFVPLTFSLVTSLRGLFESALNRPTLRPWRLHMATFQSEFFKYNDRYTTLVVLASIWGMGVTGVASISGWSGRAPWLHPGLLSVVPVLFGVAVGFYLRAFRGPGEWAFWRWNAAKEWEPRVRKGVPAQGGPRRLVRPHIWYAWSTAILLGIAPAVLWMWPSLPIMVIPFPHDACASDVYGRALIFLLTLHCIVTLGTWWWMYDLWAPFGELRKITAIEHSDRFAESFLGKVRGAADLLAADPLDPSWEGVAKSIAEAFCKARRTEERTWESDGQDCEEALGEVAVNAGFVAQLRTYAQFMHQYEDDDLYRIGRSSVDAAVWKNAAKTLSMWGDEVRAALERLRSLGHGETVAIPVWYIGCGYCELLPSIREYVAGEFADLSGEWTLRLVLVDSVTTGAYARWKKSGSRVQTDSDRRLAKMDQYLKEVQVAGKSEICIVSGDIHSVLRLMTCDYMDLPNPAGTVKSGSKVSGIWWSPEEAATAISQWHLQYMSAPVPPLVVLLNNTYGDIIDPLLDQSERPEKQLVPLEQRLEELGARSAMSLWKLLCNAFQLTGFAAVVHTKSALEEGAARAYVGGGTAASPYSTHVWTPLAGNRTGRVYFLGRVDEGDIDTPYCMLARWVGKEALQKEIEEGMNASGREWASTFSGWEGLATEGGPVHFAVEGVCCQPKEWHGGGWNGAKPDEKQYSVQAEYALAKNAIEELKKVLGQRYSAKKRPLSIRVIDWGCYDGSFANRVIEECRQGLETAEWYYVGLDVNESFRAEARKSLESIKVPAECLSPDQWLARQVVDDGFDLTVVILWNLLHHLTASEAWNVRRDLEKIKGPCLLIGSMWDLKSNCDEDRKAFLQFFQKPDGSLPRGATTYAAASAYMRESLLDGTGSKWEVLLKLPITRETVCIKYNEGDGSTGVGNTRVLHCLPRVVAVYKRSQVDQ